MSDNILNYKVFVWNGRDWEQHSRYTAMQGEEAREAAKMIEFSNKKLVKVTYEIYDKPSQNFVNKVVYMSAPAKEILLSSSSRFGVKKQEPQSVLRAAPKVMLVIFMALGVAVYLARLGTRFIASANFIDEEEAVPLSFALFIILFVIFSFWLGVSFIPKIVSDGNDDKENNNETEQKSDETNGFGKRVGVLFDFIKASVFGKEGSSLEEEKNEQSVEDFLNERRSKEKNETFIPPEMSLASKKKVFVREEKKETVTENHENQENAEINNERKKSVDLENLFKQLSGLLKLIYDSLEYSDIPVDAYAIFGIRLLIAGALGNASEQNELTEEETMELLIPLFQQMKMQPYMIEVFAEKWPEYKQDVVCQPMLEHGHFLWLSYLENPEDKDIPLTICQVVSQWKANQKASLNEDQTKGSFFVVMFTDIVGSTGMTQTLGDKSAQHLLHVHNTIVRQALVEYSGREIKLTGDGLMASFTSVSAAVDASIAIQKALHYYNESKSKAQLHVRIGLNAGEPIVEGNDLFGTVVQIAARVCNLADKNEIYVSSLVKELAFGKSYVFEDKGLQLLKGISQPQPIFAVKWDVTE